MVRMPGEIAGLTLVGGVTGITIMHTLPNIIGNIGAGAGATHTGIGAGSHATKVGHSTITIPTAAVIRSFARGQAAMAT